MDELQQKIRQATSELQAAKMIAAGRHLLFLMRKAGSDPNEPRVPAGSPEGGQWTDGGGHINSNASVFRVADSSTSHSIDLQQEEGQYGAHTIREHVGKSPAKLLSRMGPTARWWTPPGALVVMRNGSFPSISDANFYVNDILKDNADIVKSVALGALKSAFFTKRYGYKTGIEYFRADAYSEPVLRNTFGAAVYIEHAASLKKGFVVITAYPRNDDQPMKKSVQPPEVFHRFAERMFQDFAIFESIDDLILFGAQGVPKESAKEFSDFLRQILHNGSSDAQLSELWSKSGSDFFLDGPTARQFLTKALNLFDAGGSDGTLYMRHPKRNYRHARQNRR